ncbi:unnamed protein product [Peniophora sp. CBMAI 1063]|nr:unnamed protein product [Peniophora sp. CBMAI 1063]
MTVDTIPTLHIWPAQWGLPSLDAECLATLMHLQLAIPGRFAVVECTDPDQSPTGHLPYLTHALHTVGSYASIAKYVSALNPATLPAAGQEAVPEVFSADLDHMLSASERAVKTAWAAHTHYVLGDLLAHVLYSLPENYSTLVYPTLASLYPVPQRYYVPHRIRDLHAPRLDASGLWNLAGEEIEDVEAEEEAAQSKFPRDGKPRSTPAPPPLDKVKIWKSAFFRERVLERARGALEPYARLLHDKHFFFYDRPTSLDVLLASHILLLTSPPFPDPLLGDLIRDAFPSLLAHAQAVLSEALPSRPFSANYVTAPQQSTALSTLLPPFSALWKHPTPKEKASTAEDVKFQRGRLLWFGVAALGTIGYMLFAPTTFQFVFVKPDEVEAEGADDEEDEEEEEGESE